MSQNTDLAAFTPAADDESKFGVYCRLLKAVLPHIPQDLHNVVSAQVLLALKLEGLVGETLQHHDIEMCEIIRDSILESPPRRSEAAQLAQSLLN